MTRLFNDQTNKLITVLILYVTKVIKLVGCNQLLKVELMVVKSVVVKSLVYVW